jgi:hypothetical protein
MRKWLFMLIVFNIIVIGAIIWHWHAFPPEDNPQAVEMKKLLKEGVVQMKIYHLNHQKATAQTIEKFNRIIDHLPLKRPELYRPGRDLENQSVIFIWAFRDDIPLIEKAVEEWDSAPVETTKGSK